MVFISIESNFLTLSCSSLMDARLTEASRVGNANDLYAIIQQDPHVLQRVDEIPFVDTPLHIAAAAGNSQLSTELINLKPSFARKLNCDGHSPLHLALLSGHFLVVHRLISSDPNLVRVKGKNGITPLHIVVKMGDIQFLRVFYRVCPKSITDRTSRGETVFHWAVKHKKLEAFKLLMQWIKQEEEEWILALWDDDGNTVLHLAISNNQPQASSISCFICASFSAVQIVDG